MIRDKIVLGIMDEGTRRRLLREKTLTLVGAIEVCRAAEQTHIQMKMIECAPVTPQTADAVHAVAKQRFRPNKSEHRTQKQTTCANTAATHTLGVDSTVQHLGKHPRLAEQKTILQRCV